MNDRHEQSRAAFEAEYPPAHTYKASASIIDHLMQNRDIQWNAWCRALDYAAEQQAKQCQCYWCNMAKLVHRDDRKGGQAAPTPRPAKPPLGPECPKCGAIPWHASKETEEEIRALFEQAPTPLTRPDRPGWLPIETAPKDGTNVLGLHGDGHHISTINYSDGHWRLELWSSYITKPTHWMPLPAMPPPAPSQTNHE